MSLSGKRASWQGVASAANLQRMAGGSISNDGMRRVVNNCGLVAVMARAGVASTAKEEKRKMRASRRLVRQARGEGSGVWRTLRIGALAWQTAWRAKMAWRERQRK